MNQDQVKETLLRLKENATDFTLIFSGKESNKIDGCYHPETMEIVIHNKNFCEDNGLVYTAIHEFAHHIQFTTHEINPKAKAHSPLFWDIFHTLLEKAEDLGIYKNVFTSDQRFVEITAELKEIFGKNGEIMKAGGKLLIQALDLCQKNHAIFEDYIDRCLGIGRNESKSMLKVYAMDIAPEVGFENMKILSRISDPKTRNEAEAKFKEGFSQSEVKQFSAENSKSNRSESYQSISRLESQKRRIERSIESLQLKLQDIEKEISDRTTD